LKNLIESSLRVRDWLLDFLFVRLLIVILFTVIMMPVMLLHGFGSILVCLGGWVRLGCDALIDLMWGTA
jgi:hypothetical protein